MKRASKVASSPAGLVMTGVRGATATPSDDGFYLPADDARHAQMWLPWPQEQGLQPAIAALAHVILRYEPVSLVVAPGEEAAARAASWRAHGARAASMADCRAMGSWGLIGTRSSGGSRSPS